MSMKNFWDLVTQDKREQARAKAAKQIAVGVGVAVIAAAAGVATGILLAPKPGKETWEELKKGCKICTHQECSSEKEEDGGAPGSSGDTEKV